MINEKQTMYLAVIALILATVGIGLSYYKATGPVGPEGPAVPQVKNTKRSMTSMLMRLYTCIRYYKCHNKRLHRDNEVHHHKRR